MKKIVFTGGGTAGHVTPNMALIEALNPSDWAIDYIGSEEGVEKGMIEQLGIPYHAVRSGKLRRYFSWKNAVDPFNVLVGIAQSYRLLRRLKPHIVFSKGGFVALPVVIGAFLNRIPIIAHESDISPGLANRLSFPFVNAICVTFDAAKHHFKSAHKVKVTGTPLRAALFQGDKTKGLAVCGFNEKKPCVLIVGGSQGSNGLNAVVRKALPALCSTYQVIHLCGKNKLELQMKAEAGYYQLEYANAELPHLLAASDVVVSRSGANALYELLALNKAHVLVPLPLTVSRGDQIQNAAYFQKMGVSTVINDAELTPEILITTVDRVFSNKITLIKAMKALHIHSATQCIIALINEFVLI